VIDDEPLFLEVDDLIEIQSNQIEAFGGQAGLREEDCSMLQLPNLGQLSMAGFSIEISLPWPVPISSTS
jgi:hypothetical protein